MVIVRIGMGLTSVSGQPREFGSPPPRFQMAHHMNVSDRSMDISASMTSDRIDLGSFALTTPSSSGSERLTRFKMPFRKGEK